MADFKPFELTREQKTGMSLNDIAEAEKSLLAANVEITRQRIKDRAEFVAQTPITNATFKEAVTEAAKYKPGETREFMMDFADKTPLPEKTLANIAHSVSRAKFDSLHEHEKNKLFSDAELEDSFINNVANEALNVTGRTIDIATNLATTGQFLAQSFRRAGISDEDAKAYDSIQKSKAEAQDALYSLNGLYGTPKETDPLKRAVLEDRVAKNNPQLYTKEQKEFLASGKESIINDIQQNDRARRALTDFTGGVSDIVNKNAMERLVQDAKTGFKNSEGIIETVASAAEALADNPYGIFQAVMQTAPDIALAGTSFGASVASNVIEKNYEAEEIYKGKHGKDALGADRDTLSLAATAGGIIDAASDKFIAGGAGKITDVAKKVGLTTSFKLLDGTAGVAAKAVQRPLTGGLAEYGAESVGAGLTQYAGLQDVNEVDIAQAHAEGVVGFGAGASISAVTGTFKAIGSSMGTVVERAKKRQDAVETADIKTLLSPEGGMDIKGATQVMHKIVTDLNVSDDKKAQAIYDIERVIDDKPVIEIILNKLKLEQEDNPTEARAKRIAGGEAKLADIAAVEEKVKFMKDTFKGNSIEAAYKALTEDSAPDSDEDTEPSRQAAAKRIDEEVNTPYSKFTVEMAQEVLDKRIEILTEDQIANLQSYINTNTAMDNLTEKMSTAQVNTHVVIGGGNDVGARTYVNGIISAIKHKNPDLAKDTLSQLVSFAETHAHKAAEYGKIIASFDAGTPMSADEQLAIMQPFESEKKGNKAQALEPRMGTHGKYLVPKFMRLMADEAAMLKLVSDEMTTRVNRYENSLKTAAEPVTGVPAGSAPRGGAVAQPEITLDQLLDMEPDAAIKFLNPSNKEGTEEKDDNNEFLSDGMSEAYSQDIADAEVIKTINEDTKPVRLVMPEEQVIHAVNADGKVIGSISLQDGETAVQMHEESSQQGIGPQLIAEFIRRYPNAKAGSFTSNGLKAYKKALDILKKERDSKKTKVQLPKSEGAASKFHAKDQAKSNKANKFIGVGSAKSSTAAYAKAWGSKANTGDYTAEDVVFVSVEGNRKGRKSFSKTELGKATASGATIITDTAAHRQTPFNIGEREVADFLNKRGYQETSGNGVWKRKEANRAQDTVDAEQPTVSQPVKPETVQATEQSAVPEADTLERETEVETRRVSDEVLNESVSDELPAVDVETKSNVDNDSLLFAQERLAAAHNTFESLKTKIHQLVTDVFDNDDSYFDSRQLLKSRDGDTPIVKNIIRGEKGELLAYFENEYDGAIEKLESKFKQEMSDLRKEYIDAKETVKYRQSRVYEVESELGNQTVDTPIEAKPVTPVKNLLGIKVEDLVVEIESVVEELESLVQPHKIHFPKVNEQNAVLKSAITQLNTRGTIDTNVLKALGEIVSVPLMNAIKAIAADVTKLNVADNIRGILQQSREQADKVNTTAISQLDPSTLPSFLQGLQTGVSAIGKTGNAVLDYFGFRTEKGMSNPLVSIKGFMDQLAEGVTFDSIKDLLPTKYKELTANNKTLLKEFVDFNKQFHTAFMNTYVPKEFKFAHKDFAAYFVDQDGNFKPEVIDTMSLAAFNWFITKSNDSLDTDEKKIGAILGLKDTKGATFSDYTWAIVSNLGVPYTQEVQTLGDSIQKSLGLFALPDAPWTVEGRLSDALGNVAVQTMLGIKDEAGVPYVRVVTLSAKDREAMHLVDIEGSHEAAAAIAKTENDIETKNTKGWFTGNKSLRTLQVSFTETANGFRTPIETIQGKILEPAKSQGSFLQDLFGAITPDTLPTFEPVDVRKQSQVMKRTDRKLSQFSKSVHQKFNNVKTFLKPEMVNVLGKFKRTELADMFGAVLDVEAVRHIDNIKSQMSKNNLIMRGVDSLMDFIDGFYDLTGEDGFSTPFYLSHETNRVGRDQLTQKVMNMQTDKIARHAAYRDGWQVTIAMNDVGLLENLYRAVGQAMGVSLDKNNNEKSARDSLERINDPVIAKAIQAAVGILNNEDDVDTQAIYDAVKYIGTAAAGLDGIMTYAKYEQAKQAGASEFEVTIGVERDGVTNGPIFTLLQFGEVGKDWADMLSAGGWFIDSPYENVAAAKEAGVKDLYEKVAAAVNAAFKTKDVFEISRNETVALTPEMRQAFITLFGSKNKLTDEIEIANRNAAKPMLTVKNYQSSDYAASVKAGIATIELIKASIERVVEFADTDPVKHAANLSEVDAIINAINTLAGSRYILENIDEPLKTIVSTTKLINVPVFNHKLGKSYNKQMTLSDFISKTYGNMFVEAVNKQNSLIQQMTADTVKVSNMAVMAYDAVRSKLIKEAQAEKLKNAPTKVALFNELTKAEMRAIENQLADAFPEVYTALSKVQGEGTSLVRYEAEPNVTPYKVETGFKGADGKKHNSEIEGESTRVSSPGVNGVVSKVLALDGATLTKAKDKHPSMLGLFDATMNGLNTDLEAAKQLNRDMFDVTMNHSIPLEVASMSERVLTKAIELMGEDFEFNADTLKRFKIDEEVSLRYVMNRTKFLKALAEKQLAERQKYLRERKIQLNHYYAEGAAVTFYNGEEVITEEKSPTQLTNDFKDAMSNVVQETMRPKADPVNTDKPSSPTLDLPSTSSEELNTAFDKGTRNVLTVKQAIQAFPDRLANTRSPAINAVKAIVNALITQLDPDVKVVRYSHSERYTGDLAWLHSHPMMVNNADDTRGMYFPADPKGGINTPTIVLMADGMKNSGVNSETLFHELIHALFDKKVFSNRGTPAYTELFKIMDTVRSSLAGLYSNDADIKDFINSLGGINNFAPMENAKEFLAWGLSSVPFQKILSKVNHVVTEELSNQFTVKPKSTMAALRGLIQKVLFNRPKGSKPNESIDNALAGLIDVALLLQENGLSQDTKPSRQQGARHELLNVTKLNSREVFQKLANIGGNIASAAQQAHLSNMLDTVVNSVLQPLKVNLITAAIAENDSDLSATDKLNVLLANNYGVQLTNPPVQYGFNKSAQESYVHGLYLNILEHGLKVGSPHVNAANALFNEAKALLTYKDFMTDPSIVDPVAVAAAQARYDSVFNVRTSKVKTITDVSSGMQHQLEHSDYLRNFLALAATNEQFRKALNQVVPTAQTNTPTLFKRVVKFLLGIVDWVGNRVTGVNPNKTIQANLDMLTTRLVGAEYQAQSNVEGALNRTIDFTGKAVGTAVSVFKSGLATVGKLPILNRPTSWKIAQLAGVTLRIVGNNQTQFAYDAMGQYMERLSQGKQGMIGELGTELKGTTKDNTKIHTLMRIANHVLDRGRKGVIDTMAKMLRSTFKTELTKEEKTAITKHLLRTDISALVSRGYDLNQLADLIDRTTYRTQEIAAIEAQIGHVVTTELATFYTNKAHELGASMVEGSAKGTLHIPNAHGIARLWGTRKAIPDDLTLAHVEPLIDALATLRALERAAMVSSKRAGIAAEVIRREASHDPMANGITFLLEQHRLLKEKSLRDNFGGKPSLMRKGYMPDITNPYIDAVPALTSAKEEMAAKGYKEMYQLPNAANNPNQESLSLYVGDGAGLATMMRGAMANKGKRAKGNPMQDYGDVAMITALNQQHIPDMFKTRKEPAFGNGSIHMSEVFNERGEIVSYRYIMAESTKDDLLERNDDFSEVMGSLAGKIYDKTVTTPHNELVIKTLREQYEIDMKSGKHYNYITVSGSSTDPEIRDMYNLLPYEAKQEIKKHFGTDSLPIRAEALRVIFGYRKMTIANLWENGGVDNNVLQQLVKVTLDAMTGGQGMRRASQAERALMELTRIAKQTIVVRTGSVLLMNMLSNTFTLWASGMSVKNATVDQAIGIRKGIEYVKQSSRIAEIDLLLEADHTPSHRNALLSEKAQLKQLQSINPVAELVEAGLLQTIVMDISQDIDPYSAGTKLANKMEEYMDKMPPALADASKFMLMTKGSESFEFMNKMTQFSDFGARYALFKHLTTRQDNPMDKSSAMQSVINKFINYDLPTHRALQYGNDIGLIWFSKYFLRVQKVIIESFAENPGRVLLGLMMQGMIGVDAPDITDSGFLETGIFHPVRGFDNIASGLLTTPATIPL